MTLQPQERVQFSPRPIMHRRAGPNVDQLLDGHSSTCGVTVRGIHRSEAALTDQPDVVEPDEHHTPSSLPCSLRNSGTVNPLDK